MSHHETSAQPDSPQDAPRKRGRRWILATLGVTAVAAGVAAYAQGGADMGWGHHHGWSASMDPEEAGRRIDKMVGWVLSDVNATADQKSRVAAIAKAALKDLQPLREQHRAARRQAVTILSQRSIDRGALEQLRAQEMASAEAASRRVVQALADSAEVLTPEQRSQLAERIAARIERHHGMRG